MSEPGAIVRVDRLPPRCVFITGTGVVMYKRDSHFAVVSYDGREPAQELRLVVVDMRTLALLGPQVELVSASDALCHYGARGMMDAVVRPYLDQRAERHSLEVVASKDGATVTSQMGNVNLAIRHEADCFRVVELRANAEPLSIATFDDYDAACRGAMAIGIMLSAGLAVAVETRRGEYTAPTVLRHLRAFMQQHSLGAE